MFIGSVAYNSKPIKSNRHQDLASSKYRLWYKTWEDTKRTKGVGEAVLQYLYIFVKNPDGSAAGTPVPDDDDSERPVTDFALEYLKPEVAATLRSLSVPA